MELNRIYNENCLDTMERMPDNYLDLTVTSPPYDDLRDYDGYTFDFEPIARELYRVTKQGGVVVWVVGDQVKSGSETLTSFKQALYFVEECGFRMHDTMIFHKHNFCNPETVRYHQLFEYMFVLSKGKPNTFNPIKDKRNKFAGSTTWGKNTQRQRDGSLISKRATPYNEMGMRPNLWHYITGTSNGDDRLAFEHPAIFPEELARDHIFSWSNKGDLVYDPFMGSGTTGKMAAIMGRDFIGSELSEKYCKIAEKRIRPHKIQIHIPFPGANREAS